MPPLPPPTPLFLLAAFAIDDAAFSAATPLYADAISIDDFLRFADADAEATL